MPHVTFIHGIANKPSQIRLRQIWLDALSEDFNDNDNGINLGANGVSSSMIYWADVLYENHLKENELESMGETLEKQSDPDLSWIKNLKGKEKNVVDDLIDKYAIDLSQENDNGHEPFDQPEFLERVPLPWPIKKRILKWFLKDVHHYLFNYEFSPRPNITYKVQDEIRNRVVHHLSQIKTDRHIVVAHSMGTVIMYDCLKRVTNCPEIDNLITVGSPLGLDEIQDNFKPEWNNQNGFPEKLKESWVNIYDHLDPVAGFDPNISNDYKKNGEKVIHDINEQNFGNWRHDITNYFKMPKLRKSISSLLEL